VAETTLQQIVDIVNGVFVSNRSAQKCLCTGRMEGGFCGHIGTLLRQASAMWTRIGGRDDGTLTREQAQPL
jgi:hypothetical protein